MELLPLAAEDVERYAQIRAAHRVSPADAIHLACAEHTGVRLLTNDRRLRGLVVPGIHFSTGIDVEIL